MKAGGQVDPIAYQAACIDMVAEAVDRRQSRPRGEFSDQLPFVIEQAVNLDHDCLNACTFQGVECRFEVTRCADLRRYKLDTYLLSHTFDLVSIKNDGTGNVHDETYLSRGGDQLKRQFQLFADQTFGAE